MRYRLLTLLLIVLASCSETPAARSVAAQDETMPLSTLRSEHPRLLVLDDDIDRVRALTDDDHVVRLRRLARDKAEAMLDADNATETLEGPRLLRQSRYALDVIQTCAFQYRLEGDRRFLDRARDELLNVASFSSWNPSHFLDVAEMTTAVAIGYDWLYDDLDHATRTSLRTAVVEKGLRPGLDAYGRNVHWVRGRNNWDQVCNAGLTIGALAIAEDEPDLAAQILEHALDAIPKINHVYEPDGAYPEGPAYWGYGTTYHVLMSRALLTATGDRRGVAQTEAIAGTGAFPIACLGSSGLAFNFADGVPKFRGSAAFFDLARLADAPEYTAWYVGFLAGQSNTRVKRSRFSSLDLAWYEPVESSYEPPLTFRFDGIQSCAMMRESWSPGAMWIAAKGGDNQARHGHLDLGSFVLDALGERWAIDLGGDDYNLPGYWAYAPDGARWNYFRNNTLSHNTLTIGGANQNVLATAAITVFGPTASGHRVVIDLTAAYADQAERVTREIELTHTGRVVIRDRIIAPTGTVRWAFLTRATVTPDGSTARLQQNGQTLSVVSRDPSTAWRVLDPPPRVHANELSTDDARLVALVATPAPEVVFEVEFRR